MPEQCKVDYLVYTLSYEVETALIGKSSQFAIFYVHYLLPSDPRFGRGWHFCSIIDVIRLHAMCFLFSNVLKIYDETKHLCLLQIGK